VKTDGDNVYLALEFVKKFSNITFDTYKSPNRVVIQYKWGDIPCTTVKKDTQLRFKADIKSDILAQVSIGEELTLVDTSESVKNNFTKVITKDGIIGYIKSNKVKATYYKTLESNYEAPTYSSIKKDYKVNLVWHQVTNQQANNNLLSMLENTKGLTTISPTWFSVVSNQGEISSLASETYVSRAHDYGIEVWALVDDFNVEVDMYKLLSYSSRREKLINELIANAIKYNLDGINIDFENISEKTGIHYIQFIRELSVKCRNNGIILSVDNYVPMPYSTYYDREEQGIVADYVVIMAYDEHHASSEESGSVSSIGYVKTAIENTLKLVPKDKIIMGIPFYTRLWKEVKENGEVKVSAQAYSMTMAEDILKAAGAKTKWDEETQQYYGEYSEDNITYKIWLEEDKSIEAKMQLINDSDLAGVAEWRLGFEKSSIWNVIQKYVNK
jgi:spore germination protein YaaH